MEKNKLGSPWVEAYARRVLWAVLALCIVALVWQPGEVSGAYDGTLPADNSKIASAPAMIRENMRALKDDGIVNARAIASYSVTEVMGETFTCVASTTSTAMLNATGTALIVGTATGTYTVFAMGATTPVATAPYSWGLISTYKIKVATTTEILGDYTTIPDYDSDTVLWNIGIATSSTRGQVIQTASCTSTGIGTTFKNRVWVVGP